MIKCLILLTILSFSHSPWELIKKENNIQVYSRLEEGEKLKELKIITEINAPIKSIISQLEDVAAFPQWVKNTSETKLLKKTIDGFQYFQVTDMPFPVNDRAIVIDVTQKVVESGIRIDFNNIVHPATKNYVAITNMTAYYDLKPIGETRTAIEYYIKVDPGGTLPTWLINKAYTIGPYDSMLNLKEMLEN